MVPTQANIFKLSSQPANTTAAHGILAAVKLGMYTQQLQMCFMPPVGSTAAQHDLSIMLSATLHSANPLSNNGTLSGQARDTDYAACDGWRLRSMTPLVWLPLQHAPIGRAVPPPRSTQATLAPSSAHY
jgi:hypothetical protein